MKKFFIFLLLGALLSLVLGLVGFSAYSPGRGLLGFSTSTLGALGRYDLDSNSLRDTLCCKGDGIYWYDAQGEGLDFDCNTLDGWYVIKNNGDSYLAYLDWTCVEGDGAAPFHGEDLYLRRIPQKLWIPRDVNCDYEIRETDL